MSEERVKPCCPDASQHYQTVPKAEGREDRSKYSI